ncbi:MAG: hypothetical protein ACI8TX_003365 [Hyphomicrobiaceae bacterium]|jgi:hypothetical protein
MAKSSRSKDGPVRLGDVLERALARLGLERKIDDYRIWQAWDEVVGRTIARNAQPVRLDGKRLVVAVRNASWLHELSGLSRDLTRRCNEWMGRDVISELFLVIGEVPQPDTPAKPRGYRPASKPDGPAPSLAAPGLSDETVEAFERLWRAARRRDGHNPNQ